MHSGLGSLPSFGVSGTRANLGRGGAGDEAAVQNPLLVLSKIVTLSSPLHSHAPSLTNNWGVKVSHRNFHFVLIVTSRLDKSDTAYCHKDLVEDEHLFLRSERKMPLFAQYYNQTREGNIWRQRVWMPTAEAGLKCCFWEELKTLCNAAWWILKWDCGKRMKVMKQLN